MTVETTLVSALGGLLGGRIFPDTAPYGTARPYATFQQVGGQVVEFLEGGAAVKRNARVQINLWADSRQQANELMRQVEDVLQASPHYAQPIGALIARYDDTAALRGAQQDFSLWWT